MAEDIKLTEEVKETKPKKSSSKKAEAKTKDEKAAPKKKVARKSSPKKEKAFETKEEKKEETKVEVKRTEATAKVIGLKVTPRKTRLVLDLVRGKDVEEALAILSLVHKEAAPYIAKLINSAKANAINNFNMDEEKLYIASIMASDSFKMRRYLPRAKGSASGMVKRFSNVYITLKERESL